MVEDLPEMFQPRNGSIGIIEQNCIEKSSQYVSTPQRFDWNHERNTHGGEFVGFNPATVRLE